MNLISRTGAICLFALASTFTHAQECFDSPPLGDGWGWNGSESCQISTESTSLDQCRIQGSAGAAACLDIYGNDLLPDLVECRDSDGDGYGWNNLVGSCRATNSNLVRNGYFDDGSTGWNTYLHPDSVAVPPVVLANGDNTPFVSSFLFGESYVSFSYHRAGTQWWHSQLFTDPISLEGGRNYRLSFFASSSSRTGNAVGSVVVENGTDFTKYLSRQDFDIYIVGHYFFVEFSVPASDSNARVAFNLGDNFGGNNSTNVGAISINDVRLVAVDELSAEPQDEVGNCDYSQASLHGGWGWNSVSNESCPPQGDDIQPVVETSCDYSNANLNGGWGWNAITSTSCSPLENN